MKTITKITIFLSILFVSQNLLAATNYVSKTGGNVSPYTSWANAANDIQAAVDVASPGNTVLVNDGTYDTGERVTPGYSSYNRVVITKNITVKSVNGPESTIILGKGPLGSNAVRGVYMSTGILSGFTVSNGHTWTSDDYYYDISGGGINMQDGNGVVTNCTISGNSAGDRGGGAYKGTINNCTISGNSSFEGGGTCESFVNNCIICKNSAVDGGGGTFFCIVNNSTISENSTADSGGGVCGCTVNNSTIYGNSANDSGGGANSSFIYNCTICGNSACDYGGGTRECTVNNSIIWNNSAPRDANCDDSWSSYSCTTPLQSGEGNFTNNPLLISASHISPNSPCIGAGSTNYSTGVDIDGEAWKNPPSVGCDEVYTNNLTGDLQVVIFAEYTSAVIGTELEFISIIKGNPISNYWSFSDGEFYSDKCIVKHSYPTAGKYKVILSAFNLDNPAGVTATIMVNIVELKDATFYVNKANTTPVSPYKSWNTAATNIQNAVNIASQTKDSLVLVANGIYYPAGQISVTKAITVKSVSGAEKTIINGSHSHRCFHLNCNAIIDGFTITNGYTSSRGGGTVGGTINNCIISGNSAGWYGGGTCKSTVNNCTISGNSAGWYGGGTGNGTVNNCTISGNWAGDYGGGTYYGTANNCIIFFNYAPIGANYYFSFSSIKYSCILFVGS